MIDFAKFANLDREHVAGSLRGGLPQFEPDKNLATIDLLERFREGYRTFGVVLNTDVSTGGGKHWFCIFIDLRNVDSANDAAAESAAESASRSRHSENSIEYFNSSGNMPLMPVTTWLIDTKMKLMMLDKKIKLYKTVVERVQDDDWSCGVWSLYYIISRLNNVPVNHFTPDRVNDKMMHEFRKHLFRHHDL
jgi:hypothetical protein